MKRPEDPAANRESDATGLPWLHTWRGVYFFVLGGFVFWVALLYLLGLVFR